MAAETRVERLVGIAAAGNLAGMENAVKSARSRRGGMDSINRGRSKVLPSVAAAGQVAVVKLLMEQRELLDIGVKQAAPRWRRLVVLDIWRLFACSVKADLISRGGPLSLL